MKQSITPKLGKSVQVEEGVLLGVRPGRRLAKLQPVVIGPNAYVRSGTVIYANTRIGTGFETGHNVIIREENILGNDVCIWNNTTIDYGCRIGHRVKIHCNVYLAQYSILEEDVFLAPGVTVANDLFPGNRYAAQLLVGPHIKKGAQVGVNCTLLPGITIGEGALIGAGSVVTRSVPPGMVVWGNPAKIQKTKKAMIWPSDFQPRNAKARQFYNGHLLGRNVFSPP